MTSTLQRIGRTDKGYGGEGEEERAGEGKDKSGKDRRRKQKGEAVSATLENLLMEARLKCKC